MKATIKIEQIKNTARPDLPFLWNVHTKGMSAGCAVATEEEAIEQAADTIRHALMSRVQVKRDQS